MHIYKRKVYASIADLDWELLIFCKTLDNHKFQEKFLLLKAKDKKAKKVSQNLIYERKYCIILTFNQHTTLLFW